MPSYCKGKITNPATHARTQCPKRASFAHLGQKAIRCRKHKKEGMVDVNNPKCAGTDQISGIRCKHQPHFALPGQKAKMCGDHKEPGMVNVNSSKCTVCGIEAVFALKGQRANKCSDHKEKNMVDVVHKRCKHDRLLCMSCSPLALLQQICYLYVRRVSEEDPEKLLGTNDYNYPYYHIEEQKTAEMTCDNYGCGKGQWSIDHCIPIMFKNPTKEEMKQRLHYLNLQPIFGNRKKGNLMRDVDIQHMAAIWLDLTPGLKAQCVRYWGTNPIFIQAFNESHPGVIWHL